MELILHQGGPHARAALAGELIVQYAEALREQLVGACCDAATLEIDLAGVTEIDTAGLQWLLMAKRAPDTAVRFVNHSPAVIRLLELSNTETRLGDPLLIGGAAAA